LSFNLTSITEQSVKEEIKFKKYTVNTIYVHLVHEYKMYNIQISWTSDNLNSNLVITIIGDNLYFNYFLLILAMIMVYFML